jgi:hypothetical protein
MSRSDAIDDRQVLARIAEYINECPPHLGRRAERARMVAVGKDGTF